MGIPGLTKFINEHSDRILRPYELKNTHLVIDGCNITAQLYRYHTKSLSAFGGDYDVYARVVRNFFENLIKCDVTPIVIFDGGHESKKLKTLHKRAMDKMEIMMNFNRSCWRGVFYPLLIGTVFHSVLEELGVTTVRCFFEADREIAAVARHLNCPVLSYDSDFLIFNVLYLPFDVMDTKLTQSESGYCYIRCFIYDPNAFLREFDFPDNSLLPLMAALLGNDYVSNGVFGKFFNHVGISKRTGTSYNQRRIFGVVKWLKNESLDSAMKTILGHTNKDSVESAKTAIDLTISDYKPSEPSVLPLLNFDGKSVGPILPTDHELISKLPDRFVQLYQRGKLSSFFIDMIHLKRYYVIIQVEDVTKDSSQTVSFPIIAAIHKILCELTGEESSFLFLYLKNFKKYTKKVLSHPANDFLDGIDPKNIMNESKESKIKCIARILSLTDSDMEIIDGIDNNWKIFFVSLIFWLKNVSANSVHVHSIVLTAIANYVQSKVGHFKNYSFFMSRRAGVINQLSKFPVEEVEFRQSEKFSVLLSSITELELMRFTQKFIKLRQYLPETTTDGYLISTIHLFATFQSVLYHVNELNALMDFPYPEINFANFYSGTFLYNLYYIFNKSKDFVRLALDALSGMPNITNLYKYVTEKFESYVDPRVGEEKPTTLRSRKSKSKRGRRS